MAPRGTVLGQLRRGLHVATDEVLEALGRRRDEVAHELDPGVVGQVDELSKKVEKMASKRVARAAVTVEQVGKTARRSRRPPAADPG